MKAKNILYPTLVAFLMLAACDSFRDVSDARERNHISATIQSTSLLAEVQDLSGLRLTFINEKEGWRSQYILTGNSMTVTDLLPGLYTIQVAGEKTGTDDVAYTINGGTRAEIIHDGETVSVNVDGLQYSQLIFKEIFYNNVRYTNSEGKLVSHIFSQFYEIYNNSEEVAYIDGLYICNISPTNATAVENNGFASLFRPDVRKENGIDVNVYAERIWQFPGTGNDHPLEPGESCIVTMRAMDHRLIGKELLDLRTVEFEFWMSRSGADFDFDAPNMIHRYLNNSIDPGVLNQYLVTSSGPAIVLFKAPEDFDPLKEQTYFTHPTMTSGDRYYSVIPVAWIMDAVECGQYESSISYKRIPRVLDAGMKSVGAAYSGITIMRKILVDEDGEPILGPNGDYRYQDTNNSTEDFDHTTELMIRRYGARMPSWNHSLQ